MSMTTQSEEVSISCQKCGSTFARKAHYLVHIQRKTPCDIAKNHKCRKCGKAFKTRKTLLRHDKKCEECEENVEKNDTKHTVESKNLKKDETPLFSHTIVKDKSSVATGNSNTINNGNTVNNDNSVKNINITIVNSYDKGKLSISASDIKEIFEENPLLSSMISDEKLSDVYGQPLHKYTAEAFLEMIKKSHQDEKNHNIYLESEGAKQVRVFSPSSDWLFIPFNTAHKECFDSASERITDLSFSDKERLKVGFVVEASATKCPSCYRESTELILKETEGRMRTHLAELGTILKKTEIRAAPRELPKKDTKPKIIPKLISPEANIKKAVVEFLQSTPRFNTIKSWDSFANVAMRKIITASKAPKTEETESTIERYMWEMGDAESSATPNQKIIAAKLSKIYTKKLNEKQN